MALQPAKRSNTFRSAGRSAGRGLPPAALDAQIQVTHSTPQCLRAAEMRSLEVTAALGV